VGEHLGFTEVLDVADHALAFLLEFAAAPFHSPIGFTRKLRKCSG
jgi:hypothetical protein